jgi:hypothetical protein
MTMGEGDMFEGWLERELRRTVESEPGPRPRSWQALYRSEKPSGRAGSWARITGRGIGIAIATALALGGGGVALAAATTGSVDPMSWGQAVVQVVKRCQDVGTADRCAGPAGRPARPDRGTGPPGSRPGAGSPAPAGGRPGTPDPGHAAVGPQPTQDPAGKAADKANDHPPRAPGQSHPSPDPGHPNPGHASPGPPGQAKKARPSPGG